MLSVVVAKGLRIIWNLDKTVWLHLFGINIDKSLCWYIAYSTGEVC